MTRHRPDSDTPDTRCGDRKSPDRSACQTSLPSWIKRRCRMAAESVRRAQSRQRSMSTSLMTSGYFAMTHQCGGWRQARRGRRPVGGSDIDVACFAFERAECLSQDCVKSFGVPASAQATEGALAMYLPGASTRYRGRGCLGRPRSTHRSRTASWLLLACTSSARTTG
jgi:hypothetical protein